jgi:negative regulator of replication initiation
MSDTTKRQTDASPGSGGPEGVAGRVKSEKQIGVRLPGELIAYIEGEAKQEGVTTSEIVRRAIEFYGLPQLWAHRSRLVAESLKDSADLGRFASYEQELADSIRLLRSRLKSYDRLMTDLERQHGILRDLKETVRKSLVKLQKDIKPGGDAES